MRDVKILIDSDGPEFRPGESICGVVEVEPSADSRGAWVVLAVGLAAGKGGPLECLEGMILFDGAWEADRRYSYAFDVMVPPTLLADVGEVARETLWLQARVETVEEGETTTKVPMKLAPETASNRLELDPWPGRPPAGRITGTPANPTAVGGLLLAGGLIAHDVSADGLLHVLGMGAILVGVWLLARSSL
ncbi:MAG: hypothetical protein HY303_00705 [Candidatus Wallbacteria bacterium]|nr:hypothetical protein [Candidatus Wallbacteria bacterium]